jgi:glyoxylase-like metal-dependent hydrolase (beta-lactamase superfamily II)
MKTGVEFERINKIIITHHDLDHIGSLTSVINNSHNKIEVLAHSDEKPYIEGDKMPVKFTPERLSSIPEDRRNEMIKQVRALERSKVDRTIEDEEKLNYCGGIKIIHTLGHTLGHICLYLEILLLALY